MTRKNLLLLNKLRQELYSDNHRLLFTVRGPQISRINLSILRVCLSERKERGIFISIDKPDRHVKSILERHNISKEGGYVDTGLKADGSHNGIQSPIESKKKVLVVSGIFCPTLFLDSIDTTLNTTPEAKERLTSELKEMNFIMIDNLSTLTIYNSQGKIQEFFNRFDKFLTDFPNLRAILSTDKNINQETYALARRVTEKEVEIQDEWL
jgi:hypothetical protein